MKEALVKHAIHTLLSRARDVPFAVRYWDDSTEQFGGAEPQFTLRLRDPRLADFLREDVNLGLGEAYMRGQIDVDGDLADVVSASVRLLRRQEGAANDAFLGGILSSIVAGAARRLGRRSHRRQQDDVARHYDLSNDFFRLWLDDTMTYSCAYFRSPEDTLEQAQRQKIDYSLRKLRLQPGETLLDIGSGWGAMIARAAEQAGVRPLGITLSREQHDGSRALLAERGLTDRAEVRLAHYEDIAREGRTFDKIVSIGMVEHVGKEHLAGFARSVAHLLRPGGLALLHQITSPIEGAINAWLDKYIFPGAYLPTVPELVGHLAACDLRILDVENLRPHYEMTLDCWSDRFERVVPMVREQYGEEFVRMWRLYLRASAASFREGTSELHQIVVSRGNSSAVPLTRGDLYI